MTLSYESLQPHWYIWIRYKEYTSFFGKNATIAIKIIQFIESSGMISWSTGFSIRTDTIQCPVFPLQGIEHHSGFPVTTRKATELGTSKQPGTRDKTDEIRRDWRWCNADTDIKKLLRNFPRQRRYLSNSFIASCLHVDKPIFIMYAQPKKWTNEIPNWMHSWYSFFRDCRWSTNNGWAGTDRRGIANE